MPYGRLRRKQFMCPVRFATMRAFEVSFPHSVNHPESYVGHRENDSSDEQSVGVKYEDKIVHVNHAYDRLQHRNRPRGQ